MDVAQQMEQEMPKYFMGAMGDELIISSEFHDPSSISITFKTLKFCK